MSRRDKDGYTFTQRMILDRLEHVGPMTILEVGQEIGRGKEITRVSMYKLHEARKVYVKDWPYVGIQRARLWALRTNPSQQDMPRPAPCDNEEYQRNYRQRNKSKLTIKRSTRVGNPFAGLILGV